MNDPHYQAMYKQAATLQHQFHDYTHASAHDPMANILRHEIHGLTNDIAANKNPRTIENRLRTIQTQIRNTQLTHPGSPTFGNPSLTHSAFVSQSPVLNHNQSNFLNHSFEQMRMGIRQHPKF